MLPLQQAREVRYSIIEYIKATFKFKEKDVSDAFYRFIAYSDDTHSVIPAIPNHFSSVLVLSNTTC